MTNYTCIITSDATVTPREYHNVGTSSAYKCAQMYGCCEGGEVVRVYRGRAERPISMARWTPQDGGKYYRCAI